MNTGTNIVNEMGSTFCRLYTQPSGDHPGSQIDFAKTLCQLGKKHYFEALESMVMNKKRLPGNFDFTALLEQEIFHQTLFACCLEIAIVSHSSLGSLPWIIKVFKLDPYNVYEVIEVFIRPQAGLPKDVVKLIEEQILESLAWKKESSLWDKIKQSGTMSSFCDVYVSNQLKNIQPANLLSSPIHHEANLGIFFDQMPNQSQTINKPKQTELFELFCSQFYHLAIARLRDLCNHLNVSDCVRQKMWKLFERSIIDHTNLMMDRHLDQMILCAVYLMAEMCHEDQNFQEIIKCYKLQPQAVSDVYQNVLLGTKKRRLCPGSSNESQTGASGVNSPMSIDESQTGASSFLSQMSTDGIQIRASDSNSPMSIDGYQIGAIESNSQMSIDESQIGSPDSNSQTSIDRDIPKDVTRKENTLVCLGTETSFDSKDYGDIMKFYTKIYIQRLQSFAHQISANNRNTIVNEKNFNLQLETPPTTPLPIKKDHAKRIQDNNDDENPSKRSCSDSIQRKLLEVGEDRRRAGFS